MDQIDMVEHAKQLVTFKFLYQIEEHRPAVFNFQFYQVYRRHCIICFLTKSEHPFSNANTKSLQTNSLHIPSLTSAQQKKLKKQNLQNLTSLMVQHWS